jgi:molecular chaperone DnaK (HSP70)
MQLPKVFLRKDTNMAKLWGGRFQKSTDKKVDDFNSSIRFDKRMYKQDIKGSIAHAKMLGKQNIIPMEDSLKIIKGLEEILVEIEEGNVVFDIDSNGILSVTAKDEATGKEQHITIESRGGLSSEDIERMKQEAEQYAEEDKKAKADIETLNEADSYCFSIEKAIESFGEKLTDNLKEPITSAIENLRKAIADKNMDDVKELRKSLESVWNPIAESMYKSETTTDGNAEVTPDMAKQFEDMLKNGNNPFAK